LNNVLIIEDTAIAARYLDQWGKLVADGDNMPPALKASNSTPTSNNSISLYFAATNGEAEFKPVLELIAGAKEGTLFLMFMPGQSPLLDALLDRVRKNDIHVRGVVSSLTPSKNGDITKVGGEVVKSGAPPQSFHDDVPLPSGISENDKPSWAETEFNVKEMLANHLMAIVHSKAIVIDPFSDQCAVITGSHNFSVSASEKNDENLVIVRGNQKLAQAYALHVNGVYDHYSWRAFLGSGGDPDQIYKPLDGWKEGGSRAQELDFWMQEPIPPQPRNRASAAPSPKTSRGTAKPKTGKSPRKGKPPKKRATAGARKTNSASKTKAAKKTRKASKAKGAKKSKSAKKSTKKSTKKAKGRRKSR
jgi:phosphatidylserine/phosphatidylglycerophosphate/cardiolipin synthase-like enzyme